MKTFLRISIVLMLISLFAAGCKKAVISVSFDPVQGSWVLSSAEESDAYGWHPLPTGLENGVFHFSGNGTATFDDNHLSTSGTWNIYNTNGSYYDEYNNYRTGNHQAMQIHLRDYANNSIHLYFDYVSFSGNRFVATHDNGVATERFWFARY